MAGNETQRKLQTMINVFLVISEALQRYKLKIYGFSNHHSKLQPKKSRDIPNFPTQG